MDAKAQFSEALRAWDFSPRIGRGAYKKYTGHYGHVELEISVQVAGREHTISWEVPTGQIPPGFNYRKAVTQGILHFTNELHYVHGKRLFLHFRVFDASIHMVDSREIDFQVATSYAIHNAFVPDSFPFNEAVIYAIKQQSIEYLKRNHE